MNTNLQQSIYHILRKYFGYDTFRPLQEKIINHILNNKDSLVIMPTGGGKSLCFQIPAIAKPGMALVISPLIALMKDQVEALRANGVNAEYINSSLTEEQKYEVDAKIKEGIVKLLYVSPEKILTQGFINYIKQFNINLIAIDEAHCISMWGHDFRPEYTQLSVLKEHFDNIPVVALTATADKITRQDICKQLNINLENTFLASFDRPNIHLKVLPGRNRYSIIKQFIDKHPNQSGIIYCLSRKSTETITGKLVNDGIKAKFYHAGMDSSERSKVQEKFLKDDTQIICATIAFGMGIDKSNIRWIIHYNLPKNMESYYQEIGRCGRDGLKSEALLFYSFGDVITLRSFNAESNQKELMNNKLKRMQDYSEAVTCRRKILLSYFNETLEKDCGNCDVCNDPPKQFDGTIIAQKALSAIVRLEEKVSSSLLIDVLRGSSRREIVEQGLDKIKTWGVGKDIKYDDWQQYLLQMLHQGLIELAYDDNMAVRTTETGKRVLFNNFKISFVHISESNTFKQKAQEIVKKKPKKLIIQEDLFERLRLLRKKLADEQGVPAYIVFSDATLHEMASRQPTTDEEMMDISGVGMHKMEKYSSYFIKEIADFKIEEKQKGSTYLQTYKLLEQGADLDEIAKQRELNPVTIYSHLAYLYSKSYKFDIMKFISDKEIEKITEAYKSCNQPKELKPIYEYLNSEVDYGKIRLALAIIEKQNSI